MSDQQPHPPMVFGIETEFGVMDAANASANAVALSAQTVAAYAARSGTNPVMWDYTGEDPLNDARGYRLQRANAHPSFLTDDPYQLAPSGGVAYGPAPSEYDRRSYQLTNLVLENGGRLYVDHAHPEYASPETTSAAQAVLYDRAGDWIARQACLQSQTDGSQLALYKNNTDGKGAAYGTHENYQLPRPVDFDDLVVGATTFLVTRPIFCGAGRVGLGQRGEGTGFQISQRADFIENDVGLETTFNRPIINTRDEPHADPRQVRRFHVINGDANQFDISTYLRLGTTGLVLRAIAASPDLRWNALSLDEDPVAVAARVSHDLSLRQRYECKDGKSRTAIDIQLTLSDLVAQVLPNLSGDELAVWERWRGVLETLATDPESCAREVEWVGKYQLLRRQLSRWEADWADPRAAAVDLQWADLRQGRSLVDRLDKAGLVERLWSERQVATAATVPPADTRARVRGLAVKHQRQLVKASWSSIVVETTGGTSARIPLPEATDAGSEQLIAAVTSGDGGAMVEAASDSLGR
ncbi:MAG: depupylase/deamidase Dop [Actinomycetaceae bacterium]|nr:depupylase/deamidase Dop [Actinomycetaceae bacterium]